MTRRIAPPTDWGDQLTGALEDEAELDEAEASVAKYELAQRELITSVVDYDLQSLSSKVDKEQIILDPAYQRRFRWDDKRQSRLIESFLMNVPVPPIFLNEDEYGKYSVIDGKQRLTAVHRFMTNELKLTGLQVFKEIDNQSFRQLDETLQTVLVTRPTLRATIILRQSHPDIKIAVFSRINTGGVPLNAQEIRNSVFPGALNDLIVKLSVSRTFHQVLGITNKEASAIYKTMRDCELVLRFFAFKDLWGKFSGGVANTLDRYMATNQSADQETLAQLDQEFRGALDSVRHLFGARAFRRFSPKSGKWGSAPLAALFDAQMVACHCRAGEGVAPEMAVAALEDLFRNADFAECVKGATNAPGSLRRRIRMTIEALQGAR